MLVAAACAMTGGCGDTDAQGRREADASAAVVAADPAPRPTPNVVVAMHLEEPLDSSKTVVWSVAFQAAWDALGDAVRREWKLPGLDLGPPARPEDVGVLTAGRLHPGVVAPGDLDVKAGRATDETWRAIDQASARPRPAGTPKPHPIDLVAFARLKASIRYRTPFYVETRPILFGSTRAPVRGYGLEADAHGEAADRMREQARLHLGPESGSRTFESRCVVVLTGPDGERVVVSGRPPLATLRATWNDVANTVSNAPARSFEAVDSLAIPRVAIDATRSFDALVGAEVLGMKGARLAVAQADVRLTADEQGADVDSAAVLVAVGALPTHVEFDGPFLLAMLARGSDHPYALAWIGSADGLSAWDEPGGRPLTADEASPFVGRWTLDRAASVETTLARWRKALDDPKHGRSGIDWNRERSGIRDALARIAFDLLVASGGLATVESGPLDAARREAVAPIRADGARRLLVVPVAPAAPSKRTEDHADAATERRWSVTRDRDRLVLTPTDGGETLVLVRR